MERLEKKISVIKQLPTNLSFICGLTKTFLMITKLGPIQKLRIKVRQLQNMTSKRVATQNFDFIHQPYLNEWGLSI